MGKLAVERSIWIQVPREQVWQAITNPEKLVQWFVPTLPGAVMKSDDQNKFTVFLGEMGVDILILDMVDPLRQVSMRCLPDKLIAATFTLADENGGTQVTIRMEGFEGLPEDARQDRLSLSAAAWEKTLKNLKAYADGAELPFPQAYVGPLFGFWRESKNRVSIERSIWIDASREKVWRAITDPKQLQAWYSPNTVWHLSALEVGGRFYVHDAEKNMEAYAETIELLDPPQQLITRSVAESPDAAKSKAYLLREENGGTRFTVFYSDYELGDETLYSGMEQNSFGFGMMLQNIKAYLEGKDLPFPWGF